jgi:hypothetical protein
VTRPVKATSCMKYCKLSKGEMKFRNKDEVNKQKSTLVNNTVMKGGYQHRDA